MTINGKIHFMDKFPFSFFFLYVFASLAIAISRVYSICIGGFAFVLLVKLGEQKICRKKRERLTDVELFREYIFHAIIFIWK
ncbi:hypothetical protein DMN77_04230 [Paenibacillus sp. 79R4]|nr:hypothetical protein [Paenibacillus sp. 79R4]